MSWLEWLLWRWDRRKAVRYCAQHGHDITGPHLAMGGFQVYTCTRCVYRFRADRMISA
jgi:hypothetical protein